MGLVEQIGSGIRRIRQMCRDYGVAEPDIEVSESWVTTIFRRPIPNSGISMPEIRPQPESQPESMETRVISLLHKEPAPMAKSAIATGLGQKSVSGQLNKVVRKLLADRCIEFTIPEKPFSRLQKYRLTAKGKEFLSEEKKEIK